MIGRLRARAAHRGVHGHAHVSRQRMIALAMIATGLLRVVVWAALIVLYVIGIKSVRHLYAEVSFVTILSVLALLLTDWGQVAASLAQLTAGDAHHDAEATRTALEIDVPAIEADIARLADLQPGDEAHALAEAIRRRLAAQHTG